MLIDIIPFVLSYVTTASGGAASPGLGGQHTPRGKGMGKDMGFPPGALPGNAFWEKVHFLPGNSNNIFPGLGTYVATVQERQKCCLKPDSIINLADGALRQTFETRNRNTEVCEHCFKHTNVSKTNNATMEQH